MLSVFAIGTELIIDSGTGRELNLIAASNSSAFLFNPSGPNVFIRFAIRSVYSLFKRSRSD